jgi:hypothetical protein
MTTLTHSRQRVGKTGKSSKSPAELARKKRINAEKLPPYAVSDTGKILQDTDPAKLPDTLNDVGLLPVAAADTDIVVEIPYLPWVGAGDPITLYLDHLDGNPAIEYPVAEIGQNDSRPTLIRTLPTGASNLAEGSYTVTYKIVDIADTEMNGVPPQPLRIDRTPPGGTTLPLMEFAADVVEHGVTVLSLVDGYLEATVPDWYGMEDFDTVEPYYLKNPVVGVEAPIPAANVQVPAGGQGKDIKVKIPEATLRIIGDGPVIFGIRLRDLAGNLSSPKSASPITLILEGAPVDADLRPPIIPLFDDDQLIDEANARHPVEVLIPRFDKAQGGDTIVFYLGSTHTQPIVIEAAETGSDPILEFELLYAFFLEAGGGQEQYSADAYYKLYRGTALLATSPALTGIDVDITTPGGTDPDPETPENENLRQAVVRGQSNTENHITQEDIKSNATVFVPWHARDSANANVEYFKLGDTIAVLWDRLTLADTHQITEADLGAKAPVQLIATPCEMSQAVTPQILLSYTVSRLLNGGHANVSLSPAQTVQVVTDALLPGAGSLPAGVFTEANDRNALNKAAVQSDGGTPFRVELDYANIAKDDRITLTLQGYFSLDGSGSETPNTDLVLSYTVAQEDLPDPNGGPAKYHDFVIETSYFSKKWNADVMGRGSVTADYRIANSYGTVDAIQQLVVVAVTDL